MAMLREKTRQSIRFRKWGLDFRLSREFEFRGSRQRAFAPRALRLGWNAIVWCLLWLKKLLAQQP
jgi:hypothetical protein